MKHLQSKGTTAKHRKEVKRCLDTVIERCGFRTITEIELTPVEDFINEKMAQGASARTVNVYVDGMRYFLHSAKARHIFADDPLSTWKGLDEKAIRVT